MGFPSLVSIYLHIFPINFTRENLKSGFPRTQISSENQPAVFSHLKDSRHFSPFFFPNLAFIFLRFGFRSVLHSHQLALHFSVSLSSSLQFTRKERQMRNQGGPRKSNPVGSGKVTPIQVAYIVDRYLCDNNFSKTRSVFRNEAASLLSRSPVNEAPTSLLSLGMILEEYISLKEQKVMLNQERVRLEQENLRVYKLLHGMQDVMNVYNGRSVPSVAPVIQASTTKQVAVISRAPADKSRNSVPNPMASNSKLSAPVVNLPSTRKRAGSYSNGVVQQQAPPASKKFKLLSKATASPETAQGSNNCLTRCQAANESSIAQSSFSQPPSSSSPLIECYGPETPPQQSISSPSNESSSMVGVSTTPQNVAPTTCTIITSERVMVSPCKHLSYTVERNRCISSPSSMKTGPKRSVKRDSVKGRLDFGGSDETASVSNHNLIVDGISTPETDKDEDLFGMNLPALFGPDFSFAELLNELDLGWEGPACPCEPTSTDSASGTSQDDNQAADQVLSEYSSTVTELISGNDMDIQGCSDVNSVTKSIKILS
ncbi:hypothetical protein LINPERPRIM_LOCUS26016 [Linum perenne]